MISALLERDIEDNGIEHSFAERITKWIFCVSFIIMQIGCNLSRSRNAFLFVCANAAVYVLKYVLPAILNVIPAPIYLESYALLYKLYF